MAGVAAGGVVAYGVGDYVHNYIEDFGQQWHQHGVLGIATDFGAAGWAPGMTPTSSWATSAVRPRARGMASHRCSEGSPRGQRWRGRKAGHAAF
jgi:hypothetical protein